MESQVIGWRETQEKKEWGSSPKSKAADRDASWANGVYAFEQPTNVPLMHGNDEGINLSQHYKRNQSHCI